MNNFNQISFIRTLCSLGERQFEGERAAAEIIKKTLRERNVVFFVESFQTRVPRFISATLHADGNQIPCSATSFVSGTITSNYALISSLTSSQKFLFEPNINFNPRCAGAISRSNHYFAPSVAIAREDVDRVLRAERVEAKVSVQCTPHTSEHILVGNRTNPTSIVFCHYDSVGPGATDNASGVAAMLDVAIRRPDLLEENLFVFDGNEELSYDEPIYWGSGYRTFESRHNDLFTRAKRLIVIDCVGNSPAEILTDPKIVSLAFPIKRREELAQKITLIAGDYDELMRVYQSSIDLPNVIQSSFLQEAIARLETLLASSYISS